MVFKEKCMDVYCSVGTWAHGFHTVDPEGIFEDWEGRSIVPSAAP